MKKIFKALALLVLSFSPLYSCSTPVNTITKEDLAKVEAKKIVKIIQGNVEFPLSVHDSSFFPQKEEVLPNPNLSLNSRIKGSSSSSSLFPYRFYLKATLNDIAQNATVSLIYPPDHPTYPNKTLGTGLTDVNGIFTINPTSEFNPSTGDIYILEATKRLGSNEQHIMGVRTYLKWNGSSWDSMTTPSIYINMKTTALALLQDINKTTVSAASTINKIDVSSGTSVPSNVGSITSATILKVAGLAEKVVTSGRDPFSLIKSSNNDYIIDYSYDLRKLSQTRDCSWCILSGVDLSKVDLKDKNLNYADLSNMNLSNIDLSGVSFINANLSGVNISSTTDLTNTDLTDSNMTGATIINPILDNTVFNGVNFTDAKISNTDLSSVSLQNTKFSMSSIFNKNFINVILTDTDFSNANFTGAKIDFGTVNLKDAILKGANLTGLIMTNMDFSGKDLTNTLFINTNLSSSNFSNSTLVNADFSGSNLNNTSFNKADLSFAIFSDTTTINSLTNFTQSFLEFADLSTLNFSGTNFSNALFYAKDLSGYNLSNANFSFAVFTGANFFNSTITNTKFSNTLVSNSTWTNGTVFGAKTCASGSIGNCN